ncbi:RcpC/CpaB family pilus assembly protein [Allocoleopsis sp.]|uniref:RcpC/CpaB family pilus assembly protein n=1 Tax=Allocoleopsis sp. TaxID=3088169 RepID=UPI002FD4716C
MNANTKPKRFSMPLSRLGVLIAIPVSAFCALYLGLHEPQTRQLIPVPVRDLPAYHQIQLTDLVQKKSSAKTLSSIVNRYTLTPVPKHKPLSKDKLGPQVESDRISNTVAIGIPATPAMVLGGNLEAGDIVDIIIVPTATKSEPQLTSVLLPDILVLDVKSMQENKSPTNQLSDSPFVIVVALPVARRQEFATNSIGAKLLISRKL